MVRWLRWRFLWWRCGGPDEQSCLDTVAQWAESVCYYPRTWSWGRATIFNIGVLGTGLEWDVMLGWLLSWLLGWVAALLRWDVGWRMWIASLRLANIVATTSPSIRQTVMMPFFNVLTRFSMLRHG